MIDDYAPSRRTLLSTAAAGAAVAVVGGRLAPPAVAGTEPAGPILKPLPPEWFTDFGTNAEMRWDSVQPAEYLTRPARLFVRNHTSTPLIDAQDLRPAGVRRRARARRAARATRCRSPSTTCAGCPRPRPSRSTSAPATGAASSARQQGTPASGTAWQLGAVGAVRWHGVRLKHLLRRIGLDPAAVSIQATGLDPSYVSGGVDYGAGAPSVPGRARRWTTRSSPGG